MNLSCRDIATELGEPIEGTAPSGPQRWLLIEHRPAWASHAVKDVLDADIARALSAHSIGVLLIRRLDDRRDSEEGWLYLTSSAGDSTARWNFRDTDERDSLLQQLAQTLEPPSHAEISSAPMLLVCTNGKRDQCCAVVGRELLTGLPQWHAHMWECTHIGGHRFAGVTLLLPQAYVHQCSDAGAAETVLAEAERGHVHLAGLRGRTGLPGPAQWAEIEIRRRCGITALTAPADFTVEVSGDSASVTVTLAGCTMHANFHRHTAPDAPESCGGPAKPRTWWLPVDSPQFTC